MRDRFIFWDFDGTLGYHERMWSGTMLDILAREAPEIQTTREELRPYLRTGYPWHAPDVPHCDIRDADEWWARVLPAAELALRAVGLGEERARELAPLMRDGFCDLGKWHLFDDTVGTLGSMSEAGWSHVIVSNHVPELVTIVEHLGIVDCFRQIYSSGVTGYEKPHPESFRIALRELPPGSEVWMVGDNPVADVRGAEDVGIPAILVRTPGADVPRYCETLAEVPGLIERL